MNSLMHILARYSCGFVCCFGAMLCLGWINTLDHIHAQEPKAAASDNPFLPSGHQDVGWPFVRGRAFDGHSPESHIADSWPQVGPPVLWTRELGQGYSAFVAQGRRVYTQYQSLRGQYVECLNADTGKTIWSHKYDWPFDPAGVYPGPRATPTIDDGRVFFAAPSGLVGCLSAANGDPIWSRNVVEDFAGKGAEFGYSCSPTVFKKLVLLPVGGKNASMVALRANDGSMAWKAGSDPASYTPAYPIRYQDRNLIVGYMQNMLTIFDFDDGRLLDQMDLSAGYDEHSAWPIYSDSHLWISGPFRSGCELIKLSFNDKPVMQPGDQPENTAAANSKQFTSVWKKRRFLSNDVMSSVLVDGHLYGFDLYDAQSKTQRPSRGKFLCVEFLTGEEKWSIGTGRV